MIIHSVKGNRSIKLTRRESRTLDDAAFLLRELSALDDKPEYVTTAADCLGAVQKYGTTPTTSETDAG